MSDFGLKVTSLPLQKACRLLVVVVAAPALGAKAFGAYQFASTLMGFLSSGTEFGLSTWTTRAVARHPEAAGPITAAGLRFRFATGALFAALVAGVALTLGPGELRSAFPFFGAAALASSFVDYAAAALRGSGNFRREALANVAMAFLTAAFALAALWIGRSLFALAFGMALGALASAVLGVRLLGRSVFARSRADPQLVLSEMVPLWVTGFLSSLYFRCDILLLRYLGNDAAVGAYAAAYRLFEAVTILPAAVMAVAFPRLVHQHARGSGGSSEARLVALLAGTGLVAGVVLRADGVHLVRAIFGADFAPALPSLRVLALAAPVLFANFGLAQLLFVRGRERSYLVIVVLLLLVNVGINLVAIPRLGGSGAAWATLVTEVISAAGSLAVLATDRRSRRILPR